MVTRCETMPEEFQMDNGCNLDQYSLSREPELFSDTKITVDELHWRGHTACSKNYSTGVLSHHLHALHRDDIMMHRGFTQWCSESTGSDAE